LDRKQNEIKCWGIKLKKKNKQEKNKNIAIKRMRTKNELKNTIKWKGMKFQEKIIKKSIKHRNRAIKSRGTILYKKN
jgi:hypothetical protein